MRLSSRTRTGTSTIYVLGTTPTKIVTATSLRQQVLIQNSGSATVLYGFGSALVGGGSAISLVANAERSHQYVGDLWAKSSAGNSTVTVSEFKE